MNQILERIKSEYWNQKPYSFEIENTKNNTEDISFLRNFNKNSYFAYLNNDLALCNQILETYIHNPFGGNYYIWTWVESGIGLKMFISLENNQKDIYDKLKKVIYDQFEYIDLPESTRRINLKVFTRRMTGSSLQTFKGKINKCNNEKDFQLEFMYSISYFSELIFIYAMNEGNVEEHIKNELDFTKNRILEIINYYKLEL